MLDEQAEDRSDDHRLALVHDKSAVRAAGRIVPKRDVPAHPHAFSFGRRDLVAYAFAGDFALELRERQQHVQRQSARRRCRVEGLGDADETNPSPFESLDDPSKVGEGSGQPIYLVDHNRINPTRGDISKHPAERRTFHVAAGISTVVIASRQNTPTLSALRTDVVRACFALGVEALERLTQTLVGALARIDRTADKLVAFSHRLRDPAGRKNADRSIAFP